MANFCWQQVKFSLYHLVKKLYKLSYTLVYVDGGEQCISNSILLRVTDNNGDKT